MRLKTMIATIVLAFECDAFAAGPPQLTAPDLSRWKSIYDGLLLVTLDDGATVADVARVKAAISAMRGTHVMALGTEAVLASVDGPFESQIAALSHVTSVTRGSVAATQRATLRPQAQLAAGFLNAARSGKLLENLQNIPDMERLHGDVFAPQYSSPHNAINALGLRGSPKIPVPLQWDGHNASMGPESMLVTVFLVESDGTSDANEFSWTSNDESDVINNIIQGLYFWTDLSMYYGKTFSFDLFAYRPSYHYWAVHEPYEPIRHRGASPSKEDHLWVNPIMEHLGYTQTTGDARTDMFNRVRSFNDYWVGGYVSSAFSIFVAYNPQPAAPQRFTDGSDAYAYLGGPFLQLSSDPIGIRTLVSADAAHETGHIYWACDEYANGCANTGCAICNFATNERPPSNGTINGNCHAPECGGNADCIMYSTGAAFYNRTICSYTSQHVGWGPFPCFAVNVPFGNWKATYYNDVYNGNGWTHWSLGTEVGSRNEGSGFLQFDWGNGGPVTNGPCIVNSDRFSALVESYVYLTSGSHTFTVTADDGVRVLLDGATIIDALVDQAPTTYSATISGGDGYRRVTVQYYEATGGATLHLSWN